MSLHSPTDSTVSVRIPKLKVRNRPPQDAEGTTTPSHTAQPSVATYRTGTSGIDTIHETVLHSPHPSVTRSPPTSPTSSYSPISPASPVRIPRLAVRNRPSEGESSHEAFRFPQPAAFPSNSYGETAQAGSDGIHSFPGPRPESAGHPNEYDIDSTDLELRASIERDITSRGSTTTQAWSQAPPKKRGGVSSVFGFLSVKEPSSVALEQFAQAQRKQAIKGGRASTRGLPGITDRKLPADVPKVNSKWDGLPNWARETAKEAKNPNASKSNPLLHKMANQRRLHSQHGSVLTFESSGNNHPTLSSTSTALKNGSDTTTSRPETARPYSATSSKMKLRNPSRGQVTPSRKDNAISSASQPQPPHRLALVTNFDASGPSTSTTASPGGYSRGTSAAELATSPLSETPTSFSPTDKSASPRSPRHAHTRTISDQRLNVGMDNVADITAFLGDKDVSVPKILPKTSPTSSERPGVSSPSELAARTSRPSTPTRGKLSQPDIGASKPRRRSLDRISTSDTGESFVTAIQEPLLDTFPSPPSSKKAGSKRAGQSRDTESTNTTPTAKPHVRAIFPPDSPTIKNAIFADPPTSASSTNSSTLQHDLQNESPIGHAMQGLARSSPTSRTSSSPTSIRHNRQPSGSTSLAMSDLSDQWYQTPQQRLGFANPSPVKKTQVAPWETMKHHASDADTKQSPSRPTTSSTHGGKKARWSAFGRKSGSQNAD